MAKQNRGKVLVKLQSSGRGTCPSCYATRIKLLYKRKTAEGTSLMVCKRCTNVAVESLTQQQLAAGALPFRRKHRIPFNRHVNAVKNK